MSNLIYPTQIHGLSPQVVKTAEFSNINQKSPNGFSLRMPQYSNPIWHFHLEYNYIYDQQNSPQNTRLYNPYSDIQYFIGFFTAMRGGFDDFLFMDESDYSAAGIQGGVWQAGRQFNQGSVIIDQFGHAQLVTTGGTTGAYGYGAPPFSQSGGSITDGSVVWQDQGYFPEGWPNAQVTLPIVSDADGNWFSPIQRSVAGLYMEDVTDLVPGTLSIYSNGILKSGITDYTLSGPGLALPGHSYAGMYVAWPSEPTAPITANFQFYFRMKFEEDTQDFEKWAKELWTIGGSKAKNGSGYVKLETSRVAVI